jgi:hypothetical protein
MPAFEEINSLELEEDAEFERRSRQLQRAGRALMFLMLVAALLGLLGGPGVLSTTVASQEPEGLRVRYRRFERFATPVTLQIDLAQVRAADGKVRLRWKQEYLEGFEILHVLPQPQSVIATWPHLLFVFETVNPRSVRLTFHLKAQRMGLFHGEIASDDLPSLRFTQFVYP